MARVPSNDQTDTPTWQECSQALATMFQPHEMVWLIDRTYNAESETWLVDIARLNAQGRWMHQRYRYDVADKTVYFRGENPLSESDLAELRKTGTPFQR